MKKFLIFLVLASVLVLAVCDVIREKSSSVSASGDKVRTRKLDRVRRKRYVQLEEGQDELDAQGLPRCYLPGGKPGRCRYMQQQQCIPEQVRGDFVRYAPYLCVINGTSIGACCPEDVLNDQSNGLAGDLPQTAFASEDPNTLLRITEGTVKTRGCGVSTAARNRLLGARPANPREWPWMAAVMADGREQYCGGALITDRHVLTAAHCTRRWKPIDMQVRLGEYDFKRKNDTRSYDFQVVEIRQHNEFQLATYRNDIAILKLHRPVTFNTYVWPICLPPVGRDFENTNLTVIGWGTQSYGGPNSEVLMEVTVPMWPHGKCEQAFSDEIYNTVVCAGGYEGGLDACQGDSGGPLMYEMESGRWAAVGIVSWGIRCGEPGHPGVYTSVQKYLRWIVENVQF